MDDQYTEPEEQFEEQPDENGEEPVDIYSKRAILWFSILFNTIFGGALLMQNLRDVGYKKEANKIIGFSVAYYIIPAFILGVMQLNIAIYFFAVLLINISGGLILTQYFFPMYFPDDDYYPKDVTRVAFRSIAIIVIVTLLSHYLQGVLPKSLK